MNDPSGEAPLVSELLASDPEFLPLVEAFVLGLGQRLCDLLAAANEANWADMKSLAHQLKGAGGSYGFQQITQVAARIEAEAARSIASCGAGAACSAVSQAELIQPLLNQLAMLACAARRGLVQPDA